MSSADVDLLLSRQFAHDLRSPMAALLILVTDLRQQAEEGGKPPSPELLAMMEEALLSMDAMLLGLVAVVTGARGEPLGSPTQPFSLRETVDTVGRLLAPWHQVRGSHFSSEVQGADLRVGHPDALTHLLFLLLVAGLHTSPGGATLLEVRPHPAPDAHAPEMLFRIHAPGSLSAPSTLAQLQQVVAGKAPRTRQCQAHLPLEGALWLAEALGARHQALPSPTDTDTGGFQFVLDLPVASPSA